MERNYSIFVGFYQMKEENPLETGMGENNSLVFASMSFLGGGLIKIAEVREKVFPSLSSHIKPNPTPPYPQEKSSLTSQPSPPFLPLISPSPSKKKSKNSNIQPSLPS